MKKPQFVALEEELVDDAQRGEERVADRAQEKKYKQRRKAWRENDLRDVYED